MWDLLYQAAGEGRTILVTTHYVEEAERCQTIAFMHGGRLIGVGSPEQCRAELGEGILEVDAVPVMQAADLVRATPGVTGVSVYGRTLRVFSQNTVDLEHELDAVLRRSEISVRSIRSVPPTLEDVFMSLTRTARDAESSP
jgi:ABC-2 type transport system ATP-binding protein